MYIPNYLVLLQSLLASPIPDDPEDPIVARQCIEKPEVFKLTAQHWANVYAAGNYRKLESCFFE